MKIKGRSVLVLLSVFATATFASLANSAQYTTSIPLAGTWSLVAADVKHPDGTQAQDYGASPEGSLMIDRQGRYSLQIFKAERSIFPTADKGKGRPDDYKSAVMGASTHYGIISVDQKDMTLTFHIKDSAFPNWKDESQRRQYSLVGSQLSYFGVARPNGDVPISVWRRIQ